MTKLANAMILMSVKVPMSLAKWTPKFVIINPAAMNAWIFYRLHRQEYARTDSNLKRKLSSALVGGMTFSMNCLVFIELLDIFNAFLPFSFLIYITKKNSFVSLVDIDECEEKIGKCGPNKECSNMPGGYECVDAKKAPKK